MKLVSNALLLACESLHGFGNRRPDPIARPMAGIEMQFPKEIFAKATHYGLLEMNVLDALQGIFVKEFRFWR